MSRSSSSQHSDDDELSSQNQHRYPIHAIRKRRLPNDTFFDPGNDVCQHYNAFSYIEHEHENHHEHDPLVVLSCEVRGCSFVASSYHAYGMRMFMFVRCVWNMMMMIRWYWIIGGWGRVCSGMVSLQVYSCWICILRRYMVRIIALRVRWNVCSDIGA